MTWRELIDKLKSYPDSVLDMEACVWLYDDVEYPTGQVAITDVTPYDSSMWPGQHNELSMVLAEPVDSDDLEREFYMIEEYDGRKEIHYEGYTYWGEGGFRSQEMTGCYVPVDDFINDPQILWEEASCVTQYIDERDESDAKRFVNEYYEVVGSKGWSGVYLPFDKITKDTPCGEYWCYSRDE